VATDDLIVTSNKRVTPSPRIAVQHWATGFALRGEQAMASQTAQCFIGTSGWSYRSWRGPFFPESIPFRLHLEFYATRFRTAELNGVFYRTPSIEAVRAWANNTPEDFVFAWKASKFITHWKRLGPSSKNSLALMESRLRLLGKKAGPVLFQLPPQFEKDTSRFSSFLKRLRQRRPYVFEFRHPSWYTQEIFDLLRDHQSALCFSDHRDAPAPWEVTAPHIYVRAHGPAGDYGGRYAAKTLSTWAERLSNLQHDGHNVYVYFDNDQKSAAPLDAARLAKMMVPRYSTPKAANSQRTG
jgi:uncharacterized protein YecE (DUF72 family)